MSVQPAAERTAAGVRAMFDRVAPRYDLANAVFSFGEDGRWRRAAAAATGLQPGEVAVDVACGTGALTAELRRHAPGATVVGVDFAWQMLRRAAVGGSAGPAGAARPTARGPGGLVGGDARALPLRSGVADVVTIAFGLRNLPDPAAGLAELRRVLRPGGRLVVCEFAHPVAPVLRAVYGRYLTRLLPRAARALTSDPEAYEYLARSISAWPEQPDLARWIAGAGFAGVQWRDLTGGIVALHRGTAR